MSEKNTDLNGELVTRPPLVTLAQVVMTQPPGPDSQFVELEDENGQSMRLDTGWEQRPDGLWALRIPVWLGQYGPNIRAGDQPCGYPECALDDDRCTSRAVGGAGPCDPHLRAGK